MKVVLSIQSLKYPLTGIGRYTLELARRLETHPDIEELSYFNGERFVPGLPTQDAMETAPGGFSTGVAQFKRTLARNRLVLETYRTLKAMRPTRPFRAHAGQLFHGPNFYVPDFPGPSVVTIHDLSVLTMPQFHPPERVMYLSKEIEQSIRRATKVVVDATAIRDEVIAKFGVAPEHIHIAPLAGGAEFHPRSSEEIAPVLATYGLNHGGYVLYTGTIEPRKNLVTLLDAYAHLPAAARETMPLVMAGHRGWQNEAIMDRIERGTREGWVKYLGFVPEEHLPLLFSGARLFVFPSLYEGFGLPVLEALASGVPVVTSTSSTLPEVGGDAALFVDPQDGEGLTAAIAQGLYDEDWRQGAIARGHAHAGRFSWDRCASETISAYRAATAQ